MIDGGRTQPSASTGATIWLTGLPAAGKSSLAALVARRLADDGSPAYVLDGDELRCGLCSDLGYEADDRDENVRRVGEVARILSSAGVVALVALVSPFRVARERARGLHDAHGVPFLEVFVNTPLEECSRRDPKGLYGQARRGELAGLTGVGAPYEAPLAPQLEIRPGTEIAAAADAVIELLEKSVERKLACAGGDFRARAIEKVHRPVTGGS